MEVVVNRRARHVVALRGRLGNQLFQVAFARWLRERTGLEVAWDLSCLGGVEIAGPEPMRQWIAGQSVAAGRSWPAVGGRFNPLAIAVRRIVGPSTVFTDDTATGIVEEDPDPAWWCGYWQQERFAAPAKETFREWFGLDTRPVDSVVRVHVRRGDFVGLDNALPDGWYRRAVDRAREITGVDRVEFISDDPDWCARVLVPSVRGAEVAVGGDAVADLTSLACSAALVASDSTYSWWAGFLGPPTVIIAAEVRNLRDLMKATNDDRWIPVD